MMKLAFYINDSKPGSRAAAESLSHKATDLGLATCPLKFEGSSNSAPSAEVASDLLIIALGGDGTILRCVHEHPGVLVLGFNLGGLGYLSPVEEKDFDSALSLLAAGKYRISERTMLSLASPALPSTNCQLPTSPVALNDIVITREMTGHAATLDLSVDGHRATRYLADGLVIATSTGSTAYSLSAGGPVVMPDSRSFVITPMNPHALGIRPQVVSDSVSMKITCVRRDMSSSQPQPSTSTSSLGVYADGEAVAMLAPGESIEIAKAEQVAKFVELEGYDPYAVLAHKLGWTGTSL